MINLRDIFNNLLKDWRTFIILTNLQYVQYMEGGGGLKGTVRQDSKWNGMKVIWRKMPLGKVF